MKNSRIFLTFSLLTVLLAASCAPAVSSPPAAPAEGASATPVSQPTATLAAPPPEVQPEATATEAALPVATSRGPDLEATDPTTVKLASGQLQLVEFFRFT